MIRGQRVKDWLDDYIELSGYEDIEAVYIVKDGTPIVEGYYNGCNALTRFPIQEIGYSVISLLTGIAVDKHIVRSIDVPVGTFLPEFMMQYYTLYHRLRIKHLLTMTSGIEYEGDMDRFASTSLFGRIDDETITKIVKLPLTQVPGIRYQYKKVDLIILSALLQQILRASLYEFCQENLFAPLKISKGFNYTQENLLLSAEDLAKIGQLLLQQGMYNGKKIVSAGYAREMVSAGPFNRSFGYMMRIYPYGYGAVERNGSQLTILPKEHMVCVILSKKSLFPRYYGGILSGVLDFYRDNSTTSIDMLR